MLITEYVYNFSKDNKPSARSKSGDIIIFRTLDCFSGDIRTEKDLVTGSFNYSRLNPAAGPVFIEGAEPGDVVVVDVLAIDVAKQGAVTTIPNIGPLYGRCEDRTRILEIKNNATIFNGLPLSLRPMIGVMGLAPAEDEIACGYAGQHGGNMDCKLLTAGATVYLPVRVAGGLLQMGDLHAVMGDCELSGTGLEVAGEITARVRLIKDLPLQWPVLETKEHWWTISAKKTYPEALTEASRQTQDLVCKAYGWDRTDAYLYLSLQGDVCINQGCQPCPVEIVLRLGVPKRPDRPLLRA